MTEEELEKINRIYKDANARLMVGYNRRFAPFTRKIIEKMGHDSKKAINIRVNVGKIPPDHWTQDKDIGGGRILGEACHFFDLAMFIAGGKPVSLSATVLDDPLNHEDTVIVNMKFENGSVACVSYVANGSKAMPKKKIEVFSNSVSAVIDDFRQLIFYSGGKSVSKGKQDKGHSDEVRVFLESIKNGKPAPISYEEIYLSMRMTFDVLKSIHTKETINY